MRRRGPLAWVVACLLAAAAPVGAGEATTPVTPAQLAAQLATLRGRVVLVNVWATWCTPCLKEIPDLVRLGTELERDGLTVFGLAIDDPADAARVETFRARHFPGFHSVHRQADDADALVSVIDPAWNEVVPTTYLIGRDGGLVTRIQGKQTLEQFRQAARAVLDSSGS